MIQASHANIYQMGPPPTTESMLEQMENPMFLSQLNEAMNNPAVVDMMLQSPMVCAPSAMHPSRLTYDRSVTTRCFSKCCETPKCAV
jgi:hypothetical protein